jgi:hypothetical protein
VSPQPAYSTPAALRRALTDRLRTLAGTTKWTLSQLQRQLGYDRLLERLYRINNDWVVKGATALMARGLAVRATLDIDVFRAVTQEAAEADLRKAAGMNIGDQFRFDVGAAQPVSAATGGVRLPVTAYVGTTLWCAFHVDLVGAGIQLLGEPEHAAPLVPVSIAGMEQHGYTVYPLIDHIADKVAAILQPYGVMGSPSTRYKDLVDLVAILDRVSVPAATQAAALRSEARRRGITLPGRFCVPDERMWRQGYASEAKRSHLTMELTLEGALVLARAFLDPLLDGTASGTWNPKRRRWEPPGAADRDQAAT